MQIFLGLDEEEWVFRWQQKTFSEVRNDIECVDVRIFTVTCLVA